MFAIDGRSCLRRGPSLWSVPCPVRVQGVGGYPAGGMAACYRRQATEVRCQPPCRDCQLLGPGNAHLETYTGRGGGVGGGGGMPLVGWFSQH